MLVVSDRTGARDVYGPTDSAPTLAGEIVDCKMIHRKRETDFFKTVLRPLIPFHFDSGQSVRRLTQLVLLIYSSTL